MSAVIEDDEEMSPEEFLEWLRALDSWDDVGVG